ncbi:MAG: DUF3556 domain-containing protein [Deltaproteobacteria bacterium]|nr:DUF3556 domain-containing protein [Deltaproteobacteria bacterium]
MGCRTTSGSTGEIIAGLALGWNFGESHLHQEQLLAAIQSQCGFEEGELRCIFVESQPLGRGTLAYRIVDAKTGPRAQGEARRDRPCAPVSRGVRAVAAVCSALGHGDPRRHRATAPGASSSSAASPALTPPSSTVASGSASARSAP